MQILTLTYYFVLLLAVVVAIWKFKKVDYPTKFLALAIMYGGLTELLAFYSIRIFNSNMFLYNVFGIVDLTFCTLYFRSISTNKSFKSFCTSVVVVNVIWWFVNVFLINSYNSALTYFVIYQCVVVIALGLYVIHNKLSMLAEISQVKAHLFLPFILIFNQVVPLVHWVFVNHNSASDSSINRIIAYCFASIAIVYYLIMTLIFWNSRISMQRYKFT